MVLTQLQTTASFESPDQLGIQHETMVQIQREGIQAVAANKNSSICCWIASLRRHYHVTGVVKVLKQKE